MTKPSVLVTGASTGIGATYADRFARRGHDLVLVARDNVRMEALADRLRRETAIKVDILRADLTNVRDLRQVEARLRDDHRIGILVNNAGTSLAAGFVDQNPEEIAKIVSLNAMAPVRLASAVAPRFAQAGQGAMVNIGSVLALVPEYGSTVYGATRAFVLFLSQSLYAELGPKGVYVQAVLPAAVRTEIWQHAGKDVNKLSAVMEVGELVDAALAGFDRREAVTIPPLPDATQWTDFEAARKAMIPNFQPDARRRALSQTPREPMHGNTSISPTNGGHARIRTLNQQTVSRPSVPGPDLQRNLQVDETRTSGLLRKRDVANLLAANPAQ